MTRLYALICFAAAALAPSAAFAYIGPGAGLSLLGAMWALIAAIAAVLFFVVAWPIRRLLRRKSAPHHQTRPGEGHAAPMTVASKATANKPMR